MVEAKRGGQGSGGTGRLAGWTDADRLLDFLAAGAASAGRATPGGRIQLKSAGGERRPPTPLIEGLVQDGLAHWTVGPQGRFLSLTEPGRARLARLAAREGEGFIAQHADLRDAILIEEDGSHPVTINDGESTLAWLHNRRGPDGAPLVSDLQFAAGEKLRVDLTLAQIMPRVTANWSAAVASGRRGADPGLASDVMVAARQQVASALREVGPEFAGLLIDVCGFLKRLPEIERDRGWPARSAKLILDMALTRLARHYGMATEARGPDRSIGLRGWRAADYRPRIDGAPA